ncbi:Cysteine proteinase [Mycena chlorophos]|uniref:Cysteine proteinase n=1 Tax=Mycena chlorophos TaxID=658473 RepID=A0A8H6T485_MYCCL|nr:Cysteine proteinase [Mycena chlorophos]
MPVVGSQKRPRPSAYPPRKQPRMTKLNGDGENASPGGSTIRERWSDHGKTFLSLVVDTAAAVRDSFLPHPQPSAHYPSTSQADRPPTHPHRPPLRRPLRRPLGPPPSTPPTSISPSEQNETTPKALVSSLQPSPRRPSTVPWPTTANTKTYYPQVDMALKKSFRKEQKQPRRKRHIFENQHKAHLEATRAGDREALLKTLYILQQKDGYSSDFASFKGFMKKKTLISRILRTQRERALKFVSAKPTALSLTNQQHDDTEFLRRAVQKAQATLEEFVLCFIPRTCSSCSSRPKPRTPLTPSIADLQFRYRTKDGQLERRIAVPSLPSSLPPEDDAQVNALFRKSGILSKYAKEQVTDQDVVRLKPGKWLNDEIINFYGALILGRSDDNKENTTPSKDILDVHYFSTFFWSKLLNDGYEKGRLAKWTKKMDIFSKDVILIPVNHANVHWTAAAINFKQKRIESYDSMLDDRPNVFKVLREYVNQEHLNKKKKPFDFTGWVDYTSANTPCQENGYDCGVFTCQFLESLSRGVPRFNFTQKDIPYLRRRMLWEIGNARLRTEQ